MAIPLIAAALYGMAGWQNNNNRKRKESREDAADARQAKLDERGEVEFNQRQDKIKSDLAYEDALKVSMSPGQQTAVMQGIGDNGSNFNTKDAGAAAMMSDMAAAKGETVGLNEATRVSTGRTGATMQGTVAGNQVFAKPADAQAFAQTQSMTDLMKLQARRDVAEQFGKMDVADDMKAKITKLDSEGVFKAFALAQSGDLEGAAKVYQATGNRKLPEGAKFMASEVEDPATKTKRQVISVVGADGAPLVPDLDKALRSYLTPQEQYTMNSGDRKFTLDERKTKVSEDAEATRALAQADQARKTDAMILKLAGGGGSGSASRSNTATGVPGVALKDRRDYLADFSNGLEDPKTAIDPAAAAAMQQRNQTKLVQADAIFSTNAEFGNVLTAPQARAAMDLAQDPKNIRKVKDNNTGAVYEVVVVNGKQVVVGTGALKAPAAEAEKPAEAKQPPKADQKPGVTMESVVKATPAPLRTTDGGKSWQLSVPETVRDPSVKHYKTMPNPVFTALGGKSFATRQEAEQAYRAASQ